MPRIVVLCKCAHRHASTPAHVYSPTYKPTHMHIYIFRMCVRSCARTFQLLGSRKVTAIYCQNLRSGAKQTRSRTQSSHSAATDGLCHCKCQEGNLVCCSVLQCVAVCCNVSQCVAMCRSILQYIAECAAVRCGIVLCGSVCSVLQWPRVPSSTVLPTR